jgi:Fur family transcriptional regulator, ferric uptake regulator
MQGNKNRNAHDEQWEGSRGRDMDARFRRQGLRRTLPRQAIIEVLSKASDYMSAEEIFEQIHQDFSGIGLATVYRTVNLLSGMGAVTKFEFGEGKARYEIADTPTDTHHHQLVCEMCYKVIRYSDFGEEECNFHCEKERSLEKEYGYSIKRHVVQYYGVCPECGKGE